MKELSPDSDSDLPTELRPGSEVAKPAYLTPPDMARQAELVAERKAEDVAANKSAVDAIGRKLTTRPILARYIQSIGVGIDRETKALFVQVAVVKPLRTRQERFIRSGLEERDIRFEVRGRARARTLEAK